jgi:lipid A 3-O-deacylase
MNIKFPTVFVMIACYGMTSFAIGQDTAIHVAFSREISFTNENDAYLFRKHDAYYTNGIFFRLSTAKEKNQKKIIRSYELGQMIYTPLIRKTQNETDIDRPYCGFLFAKYSRTAFSENDDVFQYSGTLGVVGDMSLGEDMQNSYHKLLGYGRFTGWQYQVENAVGFDIGVSYAKTIWEDPAWIKLVPQVQASLGSNYTYAKLGMNLVVGAFEKNSNSALWNARITPNGNKFRRKSEFFLYWYPELVLQGYNATIQGGLFSSGSGQAVLSEPERLMWQNTIALCYAQRRWTAKFAWTIQDKEALSQKTTQQFGSLQLCYRMR